MKLPDFYKFEALNEVKARMGIPRDFYGSLTIVVDRGVLTEEQINVLTKGAGIDIDFSELAILPDGTLAYKDSRVLLHIRDVHLVSNDRGLPKYHVYNCTMLRNMDARGRFGRYVISATVDGLFTVHIIDDNRPRHERKRLDVCRYCLNELRLNGYDSQRLTQKQKDKIVASFVPSEFFAVYPQSLFIKRPTHGSDTAPANVYPPDWPEVTQKARTAAGWRCQECKADLSGQNLRKYLHTHHKNGQRNDNGRENLMVLCIECHAEQPGHSHLKNNPDYISFKSLRLLTRA